VGGGPGPSSPPRALTLPVRVRYRAELDLWDAWAWYEARAGGLGDAFLRAADACFERIARQPASYPLQHPPARRARLRRFPYSVLYVQREDFVDVIAVYHGRRRPRDFE
jgi:plasmid stabilization system protein ParE